MASQSHVLAGDGLNHIVRRGTEKLRDDGELVDVWVAGTRRQNSLARAQVCQALHSRSLPGKSGLPSNISAKMHPVLQMSTAQVMGRRQLSTTRTTCD
jgi:hypothetical protein